MDSNPKNPPAFPVAYEDRRVAGVVHTIVNEGMSLRDYFAVKAMQSLLTEKVIEQAQTKGEAGFVPKVVSAAAYAFADAMLEERKQNA